MTNKKAVTQPQSKDHGKPEVFRWYADAAELQGDREFSAHLGLAVALSDKIKHAGGRALVVGGFVRDLVMRKFGHGAVSKDVDLEVYGLQEEALKQVLNDMAREAEGEGGFSQEQVGKSFGVYKFKGLDVALARREERTPPGRGRKPKTVSDPVMEFSQAARRRDLTVNALGLDLLTGEILDSYGGLLDVQNRRLRYVDAETFTDDPLRVYRVMQFVGRFGFAVDSETAELCRSIPLDYLAKERIGEEWDKMLLKSPKPSLGLEAAKELAILRKSHPGLDRLCVSSAGKDGEWQRLLRSLDMAAMVARLRGLSEARVRLLSFAVLGHALESQGDFAGKNEIEMFFDEVDLSSKNASGALCLVRCFKTAGALAQKAVVGDWTSAQDGELRRLAYELGKAKTDLTVEDAVLVAWCVRVGKLTPEAVVKAGLLARYEAGEKLIQRAKILNVADKPPVCVMSGEDLATLGVPNGPKMGELLKRLFEVQLDGCFDGPDNVPDKNRAMAYAKGLLKG